MVLKSNVMFKELLKCNKWVNAVKICTFTFDILMESSTLWYHVKTTSLEDQIVECAEFLVKNKLE